MKKITLSLLFFTLGLYAQDFPGPYCDIDKSGTTVEEINSISFGNYTIDNEDVNSILVDKTSNVVNVSTGQSYTITIKGNTNGDFDNNVVVFIDWNQNGVLDDEGEIYEVGSLNNSTGADNVSVSMDITVPKNAEAGKKRARITKFFKDPNSPKTINSCTIPNRFGQILDFTIDVGTLSSNSFDRNALSVYPTPTKDILNIEYKSTLNAVKIYSLLGREVYSRNIASNKYQINLSSLSAGAYIVKLITNSESHSIKIIKE